MPSATSRQVPSADRHGGVTGRSVVVLLIACVVSPRIACGQEKAPTPSAAADVKATRRAWMNAPADKQAAWQGERDAIRNVDLSSDTTRQVVIARGGPEPEAYHAHPTTTLLADDRTMFCVWNIGHGGHAGPMARSDDGGLTWTRIDAMLPPNYVNFRNCPSTHLQSSCGIAFVQTRRNHSSGISSGCSSAARYAAVLASSLSRSSDHCTKGASCFSGSFGRWICRPTSAIFTPSSIARIESLRIRLKSCVGVRPPSLS